VNGLVVLVRKEVAEQWRTARLPVVATIFLLVGLASPLLAKYTPDLVRLAGSITITLPTPTSRDAVAQLVKNLTQFGVIAAILLAMGSVAGEKDSGTAAFVLTKPVSRLAFLGAKFGGLVVTLALAVLVCGLGAYVYTDALFAPLSVPGFLGGCLVVLLSLLVVAAVTFLGSALARSAIPAAGIGLVAVFISAIGSSIPRAGRFTPFGLGELAGDLALSLPASDWLWPLLANVGFVLAAFVAAWLAFRRQEL
jgi:ABC-2 type transport system permease protein